MTEKNVYRLKATILTQKYQSIAKDFEQHHDDRKLVTNMYHQLIDACKAMEHMENSFVRVAFNVKFKEQDAEMEQIVTRFTDTAYDGHKWEPLKIP